MNKMPFAGERCGAEASRNRVRVFDACHARVALLGLALLPTNLNASQAGSGNAEEPSDSIYDLVVDPAEYRGHEAVVLISDRSVRIEADGRSEYTSRHVLQILTTQGVESWGELVFPHDPARQRFRLNWLRVSRLDGTSVSSEPANRYESSPAVEPEYPVYSDRELIQITVAGIAPGTILDYSYTIETFAPRLVGDFSHRWYASGLLPRRRTRFLIDAPESVSIKLHEQNLDRERLERVTGSRRIITWTNHDVPAVEYESFGSDLREVLPAVSVYGDLGWDRIGMWYDSLSADRYVLTAEIEAAHKEQLAGAETLEDSLRATYRWVAQDIRYVSLALGEGAYQPRLPAEVFESGFGDCKDKATLFVSLARHMGIDAYPVLVNSEGTVDSLAPSLSQFDHMIAGIEGRGIAGYFDLTTSTTPYGELPPGLQGEVGLAIRDGAATKVVVLPADSPEYNRFEQIISGTLSRDRKFVGSVTFRASGTEQHGMRSEFADIDHLDEYGRDALLRHYLNSAVWEGYVLDSASVFDGRDLTAAAEITIWFTVSDLAGWDGSKHELYVPLIVFSDQTVVPELEAEGERQFPIDVESVNGPSIWHSRLDLQLPNGWKAELPPNVSITGAFGYYKAEYGQAGTTLTMMREMGGRRAIEPPDSIEALKAWFEAVARDDTETIAIGYGYVPRGSTAGAGASDSRLRDVLLTVEDFPDGVTLIEERTGTGGMFGRSDGTGAESFSQKFSSEQMTFKVGTSSLMAVAINAEVFRTESEALKAIGLFGLVDLPLFMKMTGAEEPGTAQISIGASRELNVIGINEGARGWAFELVSPLATLDMVAYGFNRGRVFVLGMAMGPKGVREEDLAHLLALIDDRIESDGRYSEDLDPDPQGGQRDNDVPTFASADSMGLRLDDLLAPGGFPGARFAGSSFLRVDGVARFTTALEAEAFVFPASTSPALYIEVTVARHDNTAKALDALSLVESQSIDSFVRALFASVLPLLPLPIALEEVDQDIAELVLTGGHSVLNQVEIPPVGVGSIARVSRVRGPMRMDLDAVDFVLDRYLTSVVIARPPGGTNPDDAGAVARRVHDKLQQAIRTSLPVVSPTSGQ